MRVADAVQEDRSWRIRAVVPDFTLEDVWALPVFGRAEEFDAFLEQNRSFDPGKSRSRPTRFLWHLRDRLGAWFGLGRIEGAGAPATATLPIPGTREVSLADRLPSDLRGTAAEFSFAALPFVPLFYTRDEFAAEISNATMHGVMHIAWVERGNDTFQAQMAVYVKPRGIFGKAYMALIKPFRHAIVYPAMMKEAARSWERRATLPSSRCAASAGSSQEPGTRPRRGNANA